MGLKEEMEKLIQAEQKKIREDAALSAERLQQRAVAASAKFATVRAMIEEIAKAEPVHLRVKFEGYYGNPSQICSAHLKMGSDNSPDIEWRVRVHDRGDKLDHMGYWVRDGKKLSGSPPNGFAARFVIEENEPDPWDWTTKESHDSWDPFHLEDEWPKLFCADETAVCEYLVREIVARAARKRESR